MTTDLLGPISRHIAQIAENAFEEDQPEYAIESLKIAFQMGMYPTRDLFFATLAIILSSPDLKRNLSIVDKRKKDAEKTKRYKNFQLKDIERQTIVSAIELVNDLVQTCPNAVRRYLPPSYRGYERIDKAINGDGANADDTKIDGTNADEIEWQKEKRNWLSRSANSEGPSSPENSRANSRNRSPAVIRNPIIALAVQMLECKDVFTLLALNPFEMQEASKGVQRVGRSQVYREGDGCEAADAREAELRIKYDRPGTWILLSILCSFWEQDLEICENAGRVGGKLIQTPHLSYQVLSRNWKEPTTIRSIRYNAGISTSLGDALDLIKVGLLPSADSISSRKEKNARDSKSVASCNLLRLLEKIAANGLIDKQTLIRGMRSVMERIDVYAIERLSETNLLVSETTLFARSAMRHLSSWQDEELSLPWDDEIEDILSDCIKDDALAPHHAFLRLFREGIWLLHKVDWAEEEGIEIWRLTKSLRDDQHGGISGFLSQDTWQLHPTSKTHESRPKKRNSSKIDSTMETENRMQSFSIASEIRRRIVDQIVIQTQLQRAILECFQQYLVKPYPNHPNLNVISTKAVALLARNIESDSRVIGKCLKGMQDTYKQILEGEVLRGEDNNQGESKKRRRIAENNEERIVLSSAISAEKSLQFIVEWTQIEKKMKRYIMILEAASFSTKSPTTNRERVDSISSELTDLTDLTED